MSSNDKISIVIPVYNIEDYIERTLDSVCAQTYKNLEIVVVDDGSKDNSWSVICEYAKKDDRIKPIHQENGGVTSARLNGVRNATGEWIGFVDGDDLIDEDMFELLINNAHKYNADISHCGYKMVFPSRVDYYYNTGRLVEQDNLKGLCDLLEGSFIEPGLWNKLFHNTLFHSLLHEDKMDLSIKNFEDLLMNYYLFKESKKSVFEDVCKYHYMVRSNSATSRIKNSSRFKPLVDVMEIVIGDIEDEGILYDVAKSRYIEILIKYSETEIKEEYIDARHKLLKNKNYIKRLSSASDKIRVFMTLYFRPLYRLIRKLYVKITKIDHKYDVN